MVSDNLLTTDGKNILDIPVVSPRERNSRYFGAEIQWNNRIEIMYDCSRFHDLTKAINKVGPARGRS